MKLGLDNTATNLYSISIKAYFNEMRWATLEMKQCDGQIRPHHNMFIFVQRTNTPRNFPTTVWYMNQNITHSYYTQIWWNKRGFVMFP
jgi:hypothetical protein